MVTKQVANVVDGKGAILTWIEEKSGCVSIVVGMRVPNLNWFVHRKLGKLEPCGCPNLAHGSEYNALTYAILRHVKRIPNLINVNCNCRNNEFTIYVTCNSSVATDVLCSICDIMSPSKLSTMYDGYASAIAVLNGTPNVGEFWHVVADTGGLLNCIVIGAGWHSKQLQSTCDKIAKVQRYSTGEHTMVVPRSLSTTRSQTSYIRQPAPGYDALFIIDFLTNYSYSNVLCADDSVIIYSKPTNITMEMVNEYCEWCAESDTITLIRLAYKYMLDTHSIISLLTITDISNYIKNLISQCIYQ